MFLADAMFMLPLTETYILCTVKQMMEMATITRQTENWLVRKESLARPVLSVSNMAGKILEVPRLDALNPCTCQDKKEKTKIIFFLMKHDKRVNGGVAFLTLVKPNQVKTALHLLKKREKRQKKQQVYASDDSSSSSDDSLDPDADILDEMYVKKMNLYALHAKKSVHPPINKSHHA